MFSLVSPVALLSVYFMLIYGHTRVLVYTTNSNKNKTNQFPLMCQCQSFKNKGSNILERAALLWVSFLIFCASWLTFFSVYFYKLQWQWQRIVDFIRVKFFNFVKVYMRLPYYPLAKFSLIFEMVYKTGFTCRHDHKTTLIWWLLVQLNTYKEPFNICLRVMIEFSKNSIKSF